MPVQQILKCTQQKRSGTARRIKHAQLADVSRCFTLAQFPHRVFHNIIHNILGRIIHTAGFAHFRLLLYPCAVSFCQCDPFAQKLLISIAQHLHWQHAELVGTFRIIQLADNVFERFVIDGQFRRELVRMGSVLFLKLKQSGIVAGIRFVVQLYQPGINAGAVGQSQQSFVLFDIAILAHAQKDQPVDSQLHCIIQLPFRKIWVAQGDIARQCDAPVIQVIEKIAVDFGARSLTLRVFDKAIKISLQHRFFGKTFAYLAPFFWIFAEGVINHATGMGFVSNCWFGAAVINDELLKIGEHGDWQFGAVGIAPQLKRRRRIVLKIGVRLFGFQKKLARPSYSERVIRCPAGTTNFDIVFVNHITVSHGVAFFIIHVPAQRFPKRIDKFNTNLGFVVFGMFVFSEIAFKFLDKFSYDFWWIGHWFGSGCFDQIFNSLI